MLIPITFKLYHSGDSKLNVVKAVKTITGWGLRESKEFVDLVNSNWLVKENQPPARDMVHFTVDASIESVAEFKSELAKSMGVVYELNDIQKIRTNTFLKLDMLTKEEMIRELAEHDMLSFAARRDTNALVNLLISRYENIPEEYIKNILIKAFNIDE